MRKYDISFMQATTPIAGHVTKFGGQPVWLDKPQWPISRSTGEPMRFICQIALDATIFGELAGRVAYLFISDGETFVDNTYDPEGGENALIVQPGGICDVETQPLATGPTLRRWIFDDPPIPGRHGTPGECEFAVELREDDDPDVLDEDKARAEGDAALNAFTAHWSDNKISGTPAFLQGPEYPAGGPWRLLLQLGGEVPFDVNFGDAGVGYAFISQDGRSGSFSGRAADSPRDAS